MTWKRPTTAFDGYEFEGRIGTATYAKLHDGLVPSTWNEAYYDAGSSVPELATFSIRMRVMRGSTPSSYSNDASARLSLQPPTVWSPYATSGGISVSWSNNSQVADTLVLERGVVMGTITSWTAIPGAAFGITSWLDHDPPEGAVCVYRVTYSKGQDSAQATSYSTTASMVAPNQISVIPLVEGVRLAWTNPSLVATETAILRASGLDSYPSYQLVALVSAGTTTYDDTQLATGYYTYRLENRKTGLSAAQSTPVQVATLPPQNGASVMPSLLALPQAAAIRRSSSGAWFLSGNYQYEVLVREPSGNSWIDHVPNNAQSWSDPYFLLDSQDRPHLLYTRAVVQGTQEVALMHAWKDAAGWQSEEIARRTLSSAMPAYTFSLDAQDQLHILWLKSNGTLQDLEYAAKGSDGTWVIEGLTGMSSQYSLGSFRLAVDPTGQPHVLVGAWQELFHLTRSSGTWAVEPVPSNGAIAGWYDFLGIVTAGPGSVSVLASRAHQPYDGSYDLMMFRKEAGNWLPEEVVTTTTGYSSFSGTLASNKAGTRFGLYHATASGNMLRVWTSGVWTSSLVGPSSYGAPQLGFDASNKLYLLLPAGWGSSTSGFPYVLYQEQP
ncbi:MAG: hypothetical protein Q8K67_02200 [Geothrix sp.]|nr:hypothetical protein [Geothrix sp.]